MLVEFFLEVVFQFVFFLTEALPAAIFNFPDWLVNALKIIRIGMGVFPADVFYICISNFIFWTTIQFNWAVVEWIYKKIPGVD